MGRYICFVECVHKEYERLQLIGQETHLVCYVVSNSQVPDKTCKNRASAQHVFFQ